MKSWSAERKRQMAPINEQPTISVSAIDPIDTISGSSTTDITITADISDVKAASFTLLHNQGGDTFTIRSEPISTVAANGNWEFKFRPPFPNTLPPGTWIINNIELTDAKNIAYYYTFGQESAPEVLVFDNDKPTITSISLAPNLFIPDQGIVVYRLIVTIADNSLQDIPSAHIFFESSSGDAIQVELVQQAGAQITRISPNTWKLQKDINFGEYGVPQTWFITSIDATDPSSNIKTYSQQQLIEEGFQTQILSAGKPGDITSSTTGVFRGGVTLIAPSVTGDPEGITNPNYTYQWIKNGSPIDGAIGSTYSVPLAGAGSYRVAISYTDDHGFMETVDSAERDALTGERTFDYSTSARKIAGEDRVIDRFMIQTNAASTSPWRITAFKPSEDILQIQQEFGWPQYSENPFRRSKSRCTCSSTHKKRTEILQEARKSR